MSEPLVRCVQLVAQHKGVGCKLRCGGTEAAAFPTSERVAATIIACRNAKVPLKLTAEPV